MNRNALLILGILLSPAAHAAQESHGGNLTALGVVKTGRVLERLLRSDPALGSAVDADTFAIALTTTRIELGSDDEAIVPLRVKPGAPEPTLELSTIPWHGRSCHERYELAFRAYTAIAHERTPAPAAIARLHQLLGGDARCAALTDLPAEAPGFGSATPEGQFHEAISRVLEALAAHRTWRTARLTDFVELTWLAGTATLTPFSPSLRHCHLGSFGLPSEDPHREAINGYNGTFGTIIFDEEIWDIMSVGEKLEFAFHEYLGLTRQHDDFYETSSLLFLDYQDDQAAQSVKATR